MNHVRLLLLSAGSILAWNLPSFAQTQSVVGPGPTPIDATGVLNGVTMSNSSGTGALDVGVVGGPETDIFTSNSNPTNPLLVAVSTDASSSANIVFNSSSTVYGAVGTTQPGGPFFLNITAGNNGTTTNFLGSVYSTTLNLLGTGEVNFNNGATNITATNFAGDGTINLAANTTMIGALTTTAGADTGTLVLNNASVLNGAVGGAVGLKAINVAGGSDQAGSSATITGAVDAYSYSLGTNTLNVGGALTIANAGTGGVINTTIASPTVYGNIDVTGRTNLGPTLLVNVTVPSNVYLPVGGEFDIIKTQSGTNGSVVTVDVANPTNPLYVFAPVPLAGTVDGQVTIETMKTPIQSSSSPVVPILTTIPTNPGIVSVLAPINALTTVGAVAAAVAQLSPSTPNLAASTVTFQGTREFQDLWTSRLAALCSAQSGESAKTEQPNDQNATCQNDDKRVGLWAQGFGYWGNQGTQQTYSGYHSRILGGMIGVDEPIGIGTRAGLAVGYSRSNITGEPSYDTTNFNSYQAMAYIEHQRGAWYINGDAAVGWNKYSGTRGIQFSGYDATANANYNGQDYTGFASTGYHMYGPGFMATPFASLQYTHMDINNYSETGAGAIGLKVHAQNYNFLESGLGVKLEHSFSYSDGAFVPEVHVKWLHDFEDPTPYNTAAFEAAGSSSFTTLGLKPDADTLDAGGGVTLLSCICSAGNWSVAATYDHFWRNDNYNANQVMLKLTDRL